MPTEAWLTGSRPEVHPLIAPTLYCYAQAREDLTKWTETLTHSELWLRTHNLAPVGFHIRHIAGSVERLTTYIARRQLTPAQLDSIQHEMDEGASKQDLFSELDRALRSSEELLLTLSPASLEEPRTVGRQRLPTTVAGLLVHLAEHTQRHIGEAIITAKLIRNLR